MKRTKGKIQKKHLAIPLIICLSILAILAATRFIPPVVSYSLNTYSQKGKVVLSPGTDTYKYTAGTEVEVTAIADSGWRFSRWSGDVNENQKYQNPIVIIMDSNKNITAHFEEIALVFYTLTIEVDGQGTTDPAIGNHEYIEGTVVTITATADQGWQFSHWSGDASGVDNSVAIVMNSDKSVTAHFLKIIYTLTIEVNGQGTTDPIVGTHEYPEGTQVEITATPALEWIFDRWTGDISGTKNPINITMDSDKTVVACFVRIYTLTIEVNGQGTTDPAIGTHEYIDGTVVTITATADQGWQFSHWSGADDNNINPTTVTMNSDKNVTAHFIETRYYTLTIETSGQGEVTIDPASASDYALTIGIEGQGKVTVRPLGTHEYPEGTEVTLTATPSTGWLFDYWSGDINETDNPIAITLISNMTITARFAPPYKIYGLNFGPYTKEGQNPDRGTVISEEQIRELMSMIKSYTDWVRTFGSTNGLENAGHIAHELGLKIAVGAWLSDDLTANEEQISSLIAMAQAGEADILIVGNEVLLRNDLTGEQLIEYINRVKQAAPGIPVTTADVYGELLQHPAVMNACDIVLVNYYPVWEGVSIDYAIYYLHLRHQQVVAAAAGRPVIIGETGWPSEGNPLGEAIPSLENANFYFLNFVSWAKVENVSYFYFEAFDEPWKGEGSWGPHWGLWTSDGILKPGMEKVFNGETIPDNWGTEVVGGPGDPTIEFTYVPPYGSWNPGNVKGQVWHVKPADYRMAVYIKVGKGWWTKPYWNNPLTIIMPDGSWSCDITTGGIDSQATKIAAFLVPFDYNPPRKAGGSTLPSELYDNATAYIEVTRAVELYIGIIGQGTTDPAPGYSGYAPETTVTITAIPDQYWLFDHWSGDVNGTQNPIAITMDSYKDISAVFTIMSGYHELAIQRQGQGSIDPSLGSHTYPEGTVVTITATPDPGWVFDGWSGDVNGTQNPITITMDADKEVIARFVSETSTEVLERQAAINTDIRNRPQNWIITRPQE